VIGRTLVLGAAALAFCLTAMPAVAHAKSCQAKCKTAINNCKQAANCAALKHKARHDCVKGCKMAIVTVCKAAQIKTACSPSGAFAD
jgi:hypothetical protein